MEYVHIQGSKDSLMIRNIICLAQTYKKHADEMNSRLSPQPVLFLKPTSSVIFSGDSILLPSRSSCVHHEIELGVVIGKKARNIHPDKVLDHVFGYCVGLDITARDLQSEVKKRGHPWGIPKGFDTFAPLSDVVIRESVDDPNDLLLELSVNGSIRQQESTKRLHWSIEEIISFISKIMTLDTGDIILTGTPDGVGEIKKGDVLDALLYQNNRILCSVTVGVKEEKIV
jgi:2-keto-4-pentenoate hydratase/2-oxohepta-3-ene-1,7-dioic acid hydratase in catechol pathway